jgi:hypothetical protein
MIRVNTENSTYEIDTVNKRMRRLKGSALPTLNQGPDQVWKHYVGLSKVGDGRYLIEWDTDGHRTITSRILSEEDLSPTNPGVPAKHGEGQPA